MPDILDTAINAGNFNTLVTAITVAGLDTTLKGHGPFTVFAPTDEAFSKLPSGAVEALLEDVIQLRKVLEYHIVLGKFVAAKVAKLDSVMTTSGLTAKIDSTNGVKINDATVVMADIEAENGVIHVIDTLLMPQ